MPSLEEILHAIGTGIGTAGKIGGTALGAALTPPAMILAARQGRSPFSALPGYQPPMTPYQQAQLDNLKQQQDFNRQLLGALGLGGEGGQPAQAGGTPQVPTPLAAEGARTLTPQQPAAAGVSEPRKLRVKGVSIGAGGKPTVSLESPRPKAKVYDQGTINPATGQAFQPGEQDPEGNTAIVKPPKVTATTQSMVEAAPKVIQFIGRLRGNLDTLEKQGKVGPVMSRFEAAKTALGVPDPEWRKYSTNADLLLTLLMRMHQGARGGVAIMQHFQHLIDQNRQSPENMRAALDVIEDYANDLTKSKKLVVPSEPGTYDDTSDITGAPAASAAPAGSAPGTTPSIQAARDRFRSIVSPGTVSRAAGGPVMAGQPAVVGEFGPEVIRPQGNVMVQPMQAMRLQAGGQPDQNQARKLVRQAQLSPDQARGAAYTGMQGTPTTTIPPGQPGSGIGQGVGVADQDLIRSRTQPGTWTWDPNKGRSVFVPSAQ